MNVSEDETKPRKIPCEPDACAVDPVGTGAERGAAAG
jgi:hypothetical protein